MHILALCCLPNLKKNNIIIDLALFLALLDPERIYPSDQIKENLATKRSSG